MLGGGGEKGRAEAAQSRANSSLAAEEVDQTEEVWTGGEVRRTGPGEVAR